MGSRTPMQKCSICHQHDTRANDMICYRCRPYPRIYRDGDTVFV